MVYPAPPTENGIPWGALFVGGLAFVGLIAFASDNEPKQRCCGACGRAGHQHNNCPYTGQRAHFSRSVPRSRRCQCCGQSRYETQRHHPRGRADASDGLDVCGDCHVVCGHGGHYQNPARKPYVCRIMNRPARGGTEPIAQRESLATCQATIEETPAWLNFQATEALHEREELDRARFGRVRRRLEKKYEDPHDVLIEAERFKRKIAREGRR
jgi:hypothetical protein